MHHSPNKISVVLIMLIIFFGLVQVPVAHAEMEEICKFEGPDTRAEIELKDFVIRGPVPTEVGDTIVVFFTLTYVGKKYITFDRVFVGAKLPDGSEKAYEDESYRGRILKAGESIHFNTEVEVNLEGEWILWPACVYTSGDEVVELVEPWHKCGIVVKAYAPPPTTPTPALKPDLAFDPSYSQPLGLSSCNGFYAHIKNIGSAKSESSGYTNKARFLVYSGEVAEGSPVFDEEVGFLPLDAGETRTLYTGEPFWGVPGHTYTLKVVLDPGDEIDEESEFNNERTLPFNYRESDLPSFDLEVKDLELVGGSIRFKVKHTGCVDSPPVRAHLGAEYPAMEFAPAQTVEFTSTSVYSLSGSEEATFQFFNVDPYLEEIRMHGAEEICVWIDEAEVSQRTVEGSSVTIREENINNNRACLALTELPLPNLVIRHMEIEDTTLYCIIRNEGNAPLSEPFNISVSLSDWRTNQRYEFEEEFTPRVTLYPNGEERVSFDLSSCPCNTRYTVIAEVNPDHEIREIDFSDNTKDIAWVCGRIIPVDLSINRIWLEDRKTVCYEIENKGWQASPPTETKIFLSNDGRNWPFHREGVFRIDEDSLDGGEKRTVCVDASVPLYNGSWGGRWRGFETLYVKVEANSERLDFGDTNPNNDVLIESFENTCANGIHDPGEEGVDCGGVCPARCQQCLLDDVYPGSAEDAGYFSLNSNVVRQTALIALQEYANCLRDSGCRNNLTVFDTSLDFSSITADDLANNPDYIMEAVAYYVDKHTTYMYDDDCDICDHDGAISAEDMILYSGSRSGKIAVGNADVHVNSCPTDYCGDCEDHAILREALMRSLGVSWRCAFCADHYDGYFGGGHTFNLVYYRNKWRIMDYGPLGIDFSVYTYSDQHDPDNAWNDHVGEYWCPDWISDPACWFCCNHDPYSETQNYHGGDECCSGDDLNYYKEYCP